MKRTTIFLLWLAVVIIISWMFLLNPERQNFISVWKNNLDVLRMLAFSIVILILLYLIIRKVYPGRLHFDSFLTTVSILVAILFFLFQNTIDGEVRTYETTKS